MLLVWHWLQTDTPEAFSPGRMEEPARRDMTRESCCREEAVLSRRRNSQKHTTSEAQLSPEGVQQTAAWENRTFRRRKKKILIPHPDLAMTQILPLVKLSCHQEAHTANIIIWNNTNHLCMCSFRLLMTS